MDETIFVILTSGRVATITHVTADPELYTPADDIYPGDIESAASLVQTAHDFSTETQIQNPSSPGVAIVGNPGGVVLSNESNAGTFNPIHYKNTFYKFTRATRATILIPFLAVDSLSCVHPSVTTAATP